MNLWFLAWLLWTTPLQNTAQSEVVRIKSDEGATLVGDLWLPPGEAKFPAIVMIHSGTRNRREWEDLPKNLSNNGFVVLAIDLRGHGQSDPLPPGQNIFNDPNLAPRDLDAVLRYLRNHLRVEPSRIGVLGSSIGGNLACVASAKLGIRAAVQISGKTSAVTSLAGTDNIAMNTVLHISSEQDGRGERATWAKELYEMTAEPRELVIVPGREHGVAIIRRDTKLTKKVFDWFKTHL